MLPSYVRFGSKADIRWLNELRPSGEEARIQKLLQRYLNDDQGGNKDLAEAALEKLHPDRVQELNRLTQA